MKKLVFATVLVLAGVVVPGGFTEASAANPVHWEPSVETTGGDVHWDSDTLLIDGGFAEYLYSYEITGLDVRVQTILGPVWFDVLGQIPSEDRSGNGSEPGPLPIILAAESFAEPGVISATIGIGIYGSGQGYMDITNVWFGSLFGSDITKISIDAIVDVEAVPEPASMVLLIGGGLAMVARRRRSPRAA